jgi:hypothetical protein
MAQSEKLSKSQKEDRDILVKVDGYFSSALNSPTWVSARENMMTCHKYKEGDQWTSEELTELKNRHQPPTVNNQVKVTIDRMVGQFVKTRTRIGYRGRNSPTDEPVANTLSDLFLYIRQNTQLEFEEREMVEDGFTGGFGVLEASVTFDDMFKPDIQIRHEDCFSIFPDPNSKRYDWNKDAKFICRAKWVDVDEAKELYPDKSIQISGMVTDNHAGLLGSIDSFKKDNYIDPQNERIRIVECEYKVLEKKTMLFFSDGTSVDSEDISTGQMKEIKASGREYRKIERLTHKMYVGVFSGGVLFEHKEVDRTYFKFIPYFADRKKSGEPYSRIFISLTMQDAINKRESKALHLLSTNQSIYEEDAVSNENELATEVARPDGQVKLRRGGMEKFRLEKNLDLAVTQFNMHNQAKSDYRQITGVNPDALGEKSEVRSGIGIARKQAMTDMIVAPQNDNIRRTRVILANVVLELIQKNFTEEKIVYITDDLNKSRTVSLSKDHIAAIKQSQYDVIVEDLPDVTTIQQEQLQTIGNLLPQILPFGPFWVRFLIQMSDLRDKEAILKQLEQASQPPPADPKINLTLQWTELPAEQQAAFAQKMGMPSLVQAIMANPQQPAHISKIQGEVSKEAMKGDVQHEKMKGDMQKEMMKGQMQKESVGSA